MKNRGKLVFVFLIIMTLAACFVSAAVNVSNQTGAAKTTGLSSTAEGADKVVKAYKCLENRTADKTSLGLPDATFAVLALGSNANAKSIIEANKDSASCWPKGACKIKETAQVALAYKRAGESTSDIEKWLNSKNATSTELKWYLQIDIPSKELASCIITEGGRKSTIRVLDNMQIDGNPGSCFAIDMNGYMLRVNPSCYEREIDISCDKDFVSSLLYQKGTGGTIFVPSETHSEASSGHTTEKVSAKCFKTAGSCDYEGTLWAALAMQKLGEDTDAYLPYLLALSDDNERFFPETFLYILGGGDEQYNSIIQSQKQGKFWEIVGASYNKYYYTSLAMLALNGQSSNELDAAKDYLLGIQPSDGCWSNTRDTAFILYSGWPKTSATPGPTPTPPACEPTFSCGNLFACTTAGGISETGYACPNAGQICCSANLQTPTCAQMAGQICNIGYECNANTKMASDGTCCMGSCLPIPQQANDTCTPAPTNGICKTACADNEDENYVATCVATGERCCTKQAGSSLWIWIVILVILIGLAVLAIVYKEKTKIYWFKLREWFKTKFKKKPTVSGAPQMPVRGPMQYPAQRPSPMMPRGPPSRAMPVQRAPARPLSPRDKEMEETLKKLKEMSK